MNEYYCTETSLYYAYMYINKLILSLHNILFYRFLCSHCQRFPGLTRWLIRPDPGKVKPLIITKREYPHHRWEPVYIGTQNDPFYAEEMSWEGRQDKMSQVHIACIR